MVVPSGKHTKKLWKITMFNGKIHYKWQFSIAMLNYQRVISFRNGCTFNGNQVISSLDSGELANLPCLPEGYRHCF